MAILVVVCGKIEKLSDWNKNWCGSKKNKKLCARGRGGDGRGGIGGGPNKKMGVIFFFFFFLQLSRGPKGPSRWPKATSPPQELEVGARRAPYLLVGNIYVI